jgi:hypothetical protein
VAEQHTKKKCESNREEPEIRENNKPSMETGGMHRARTTDADIKTSSLCHTRELSSNLAERLQGDK